MDKFKFYLSLLITLAAIFFLITGSRILGIALINDPLVPFGTVITWLGFISFPYTIYIGFRPLRNRTKYYRWFVNLNIVLLVMGFLWGLIAFYLANNWSFTFSGSIREFRGSAEAGAYYWLFNYTMIGALLLTLFTGLFLQLFKGRR